MIWSCHARVSTLERSVPLEIVDASLLFQLVKPRIVQVGHRPSEFEPAPVEDLFSAVVVLANGTRQIT